MKIARKIADIQGEDENYNAFIARVGFAVKDTYDFATELSEDITTVLNCRILFILGAIDLILYKDLLKQNFVPIWNTLTQDEKLECVRNYNYPAPEDLSQYYTDAELEQFWSELVVRTKLDRAARFEAARVKVSYQVSPLVSLQFYNDTKAFKDDYIDANIPSLYLWLTNGSYMPLGIDFTNNGFAQKPYYTDFMRDFCIDIFIDGLY